MDVATVVFSHVQCVKTRVNLALVSKLWREASKPAAAYPRRFDFGWLPRTYEWRSNHVIGMLDNDEALSLPYERVVGLLGEYERVDERVVGLLGEPANSVLCYSVLCYYAARRGSVRLLKWARENNLDWGEATCSDAVLNGHLPALQYLHENGCPWDKWTCSRAAMNGHLPVLQYLHENGCPWDSDTCYWAASNGHLPVLQYLYENGCPLNSHACLQAAGNGHLSVLKYLYENGCPWDSFFTWQHAAHNKHWDCLQCMVDIKCPGWELYAEKYAKHLR